MVDMKITYWKGCDQAVAAAIKEFEEQSSPYSLSSRRYPLLRLIKEVIDPAVADYINSLPTSYRCYIASTEIGFSELIKTVGFDTLARAQRHLLRHFVLIKDQQTSLDRSFSDTVESIIELVNQCANKPQIKLSPVVTGGTINSQRKLGFCEFCGNQTEFSKFIRLISEHVTIDTLFPINKKIVLSHRYCSNHRPRLANGQWNPLYRQGKRSLEQFNKEVLRLRRQCAKPSKVNANSGDALIDYYFSHWMLSQTFTPVDICELRNIARRMTDSKLTDIKKKILALKHQGLSQSEVANALTRNHHIPMTRQAVSKALASVRKEFYIQNVTY